MAFVATSINLTPGGAAFSLDFTGPAVTLRNLDGRRIIYFGTDATPGDSVGCVMGPGESITVALGAGAEVLTFHVPTSTSLDPVKLQIIGFRP